MDIEFRKITEFPRGTLATLLKDGYSSLEALREAQAAFTGEAERLGLETEEGVVAMIKELRK